MAYSYPPARFDSRTILINLVDYDVAFGEEGGVPGFTWVTPPETAVTLSGGWSIDDPVYEGDSECHIFSLHYTSRALSHRDNISEPTK